MGIIQLRRPWVEQPHSAAGLNPAHWLAGRVLFAHSGIDAVGEGVKLTSSSERLNATLNANGNPTLNGSRGWSGNGSGGGLTWTLPVALTYPITLSAWFYGTAGTTTDNVLMVTRTGGGSGAQYLGRSSAELPIALSENSAGSSTSASAGAGYTFAANEWVHGVAVFVSNTDRKIYVNGGNVGTSTGSIAMPSDLTVVQVLANNRTVIGGVALPVIIAAELSADDVARLFLEQRTEPWQLFAPRTTYIASDNGTLSIVPDNAGGYKNEISTRTAAPKQFYIRRSYTEQPQSIVELNPKYGFTQDNSKILLPLYNGIKTMTRPETVTLEAANGNPYRGPGNIWPYGHFLFNRPNQYTNPGECRYWYSTDKFIDATGDWTMVWAVAVLTDTYYPSLAYGADSDSSGGWGASIGVTSTGASFKFANTTPTGYSASISHSLGLNNMFFGVATRRGNTLFGAGNGKWASTTISGAMRTSANGLQSCTSRLNDESGYHACYLAGIRNGSIDPDLAIELSQNIWQLFSPRKSVAYATPTNLPRLGSLVASSITDTDLTLTVN